MKNNDNDRLLAHKRRVDSERRERAVARKTQDRLRATTPGTATPASIMAVLNIPNAKPVH